VGLLLVFMVFSFRLKGWPIQPMREKDRAKRQPVMDNTGGMRSRPNGAGRTLTGRRRLVSAIE
jgi:hypothetical protein